MALVKYLRKLKRKSLNLIKDENRGLILNKSIK